MNVIAAHLTWFPQESREPAGLILAKWRDRPQIILWTAAALFAAVSVLRWFVDGNGQAVALLYVIPIALLALFFGRASFADIFLSLEAGYIFYFLAWVSSNSNSK